MKDPLSARSHGATATATAICDQNGLHRMSIGHTTWCHCDCKLQLQHIGVADTIQSRTKVFFQAIFLDLFLIIFVRAF